MMHYELFKEVVAEKIIKYIPQEYKDAKVEIHKVTKVNRELEAVKLISSIREEYRTCPTIRVCFTFRPMPPMISL